VVGIDGATPSLGILPIPTDVFLGKDTAPYSETRGWDVYALESFASSEDFRWELAMHKSGANGMNVVVYFDNDDHREEETSHICVLSR
jgi:hypothetical protein